MASTAEQGRSASAAAAAANADGADRGALREQVRARYAAAALAMASQPDGASCGSGCCGGAAGEGATGAAASGEVASGEVAFGAAVFGQSLYNPAHAGELPAAALAASLGCGNPIAVAELRAGESVLDLGSGGGIDVILSARRVGPEGRAYGLDMTDEMLDLARRNAREAGVANVEFLRGHIEQIPLPEGSVDVVISNCVINLSVDKPSVFAEMHRVLRPGGRVGVSDVVAEDRLTPAQRAERGDYAGCIAGALSKNEYLEQLQAAGFTNATVTFTHEVADGLHGAIIRATK